MRGLRAVGEGRDVVQKGGEKREGRERRELKRSRSLSRMHKIHP